jgi:amino acid adenylation domain-containing protein/FkbM family methyltransferase
MAVAFGGQSLSYRELYDKSHDLAIYLQSMGVGPDSVVGLCLERSIEMMVAIMGTALAGGAYLPLDPDYPDERLAYMVEDSGSSVLLTQRKLEGRIGALSGGEARLVALDAGWPEVSERAAALKRENAPLRREVGPHNLCYVIYTSGSTGKPKGVLVEHRALVNRIHWMQKRYALGRSDVVLQKTPYSFDVSVWEFFWPMMAGASVVFAVPGGHKDAGYLEELINEAKVTTLHFVPSMLYSFLENARADCGCVRRVFCSGEALDTKGVDGYKKRFPNALLHNLYGPTEAAIDVTAFDCSGLNYPFVPIGVPIDNIQIHILDGRNRPQPIGVPGELHIAGDGLARGYLNRPELTEEKFVANPFEPGGRMYKTGDLARWLEDGNIQYLGRIDTQVKIRGFRIELGEIEARLNQHPQVQDCAVAPQGEGAEKRLIAFYRAKETTADHLARLPGEELRAHLLKTLPEYMAPAAFVSLVAIPLSSNGKVDRRALARMDMAMESGREYLAPRNETEKQLVEIWCDVLNLAAEKVGVNDNFFELGGHSLLATRLISKIRSQMDVDLPLKALFEGGSVAQLAQLIAKAERSDIPPIRPVDRAQFDRLPLSFAQERLWFINQLEPDSAGYNAPGAVTIQGELDIDQLEQAFNLIIARHENLRTVFPSQEGLAHQQILDRVDFKLERIDLSHYTDKSARDNEAMRLCRSDAATPFDLAGGPLIRGKVIKLAVDEHTLMLNMHHIISDGWSMGVLIKELGLIMEAFRQGRRPELAPLPIQYVDYSVWQRNWLEEGGVLARQLSYWQGKLAGVPESLDLATDYPRPNIQSFVGATQTFALDAQLTAQLKRLADEQGVTLYMVLLAAFKVLLHRYTGHNDICVGSPIANRQYGETEGLIGMFVNILALRSRVESDDTFAALLAQVKNTCLEAYEHQDAPFEKVVDLLQPQRNLAISPIFQVTITLQNTAWVTPNPSIQPYSLDSGISKFDLSFDFTETTEGLAGSVEYSAALYKPRTVARMIEHFVAVCRAGAAAPGARVRDLDYLSEAEKRELLVGFNDTHVDFPKDKCLHHLFVEQVARDGGNTAVVCGDERLTYQELYARSRDLALYLQSEGVGPDTLVGLCMERSLEMVVSLLGILQAGGAYVPLDPDYPDERLSHMLLDSRAAIVLTQEKLEEKLNGLVPADTQIIALDRRWSEIDDRVAGLKAENVRLQERVEPHHLAYVIYTSGSTGRPKGVMNEHRGVVNRLIWMQRAYGLGVEDAVLQKTPFSFDVSVWEFFWPLLAGARLVMARPEGHKDPGYLVDTIRRNRITTLHFVPPMLQVFLEHVGAEQCFSLTRVICSGEALPSMLVRRFAERLPHARLYNLYGPTEAAVDVTAWTCPTEKVPTIIPIGSPIANTQMYILDGHGAPVPIGVAGELHIGGVQVARGYLNQPDLTAERFVRDPFAAEAGARMYKTGDLARWRDDGTIEFLGRNDFQVKIRGFRIELGEIEARMMEHEGVREAVVVAREDTLGEKRLVAYYTPAPAHASPVVQLLRLRKTDAGAAANYCTLPNGLTVFHQNQSETDFVYDEIFEDDGYLRHGVTLNDGDCVFDVGANIGLFSLFVGQRCRNATIYAFEPIPPVFETLQLNSKLHGWAGKFYKCGLAETSKQEVFTFYPHNTVISSGATSRGEARQIVKSYLLNQQEGADVINGPTAAGEFVDELLESRLESQEYTCQLRTVSEIIEENGLERIDLLKIDVEKAEHDVLKGIKDGDWPKIRQLVIEVHDVAGRLGEIVALLEARGYAVNYEQCQSLQNTTLYNLYACRPTTGIGSSNGNRVGKRVAAEKSWGSPESLLRDVRAFLSERLPEYMVPTAYAPLDEMPLTPNGKLDRKALPAPESGPAASRAYEAPQGEIEAALASVWSDVLRVERIGRHDNFFEIGGHSLLAVRLLAKTNRRFRQTLPLAALFTAPNIAALAKLISSEEAPSFDILVPIQTNGAAPPVFAVPGVGGNVLSLRPLSKALGANQPFFGLQAVGLDGKRPPLDSVEQTAQANIAALKTIQPGGPYSLIGHSYGGVVAYEMARILLEQGEGISSLILLDSIAPEVMQRNLDHDEVAELVEACTAVADINGARPEVDVEPLLRMSDEENVHYVAGLLNDRGLEIDREQFAAFYRVYRVNLLCYRAYTPPPLSRGIDVSLYRATQGRPDRLNLPPDYGWGRLLQRPIRIYDVEADHFSILKKARIIQSIGV